MFKRLHHEAIVSICLSLFGGLLITNSVSSLVLHLLKSYVLCDLILMGFMFLGICPFHSGYPVHCLWYSLVILFLCVELAVMSPLSVVIFLGAGSFQDRVSLSVHANLELTV